MNKYREAIAIAVQTGSPVILWGGPGLGKTSWVSQLARATGRHLEVLIGSLRDPVDFGGLPVAQPDGRVKLAPMPWVGRLQDMAAAGRSSILFLDEVTTAPPAVQAALLRVVLERVVGDEELPADLWIIAAANPPEVAAGGYDLSAPLANRFAHFEWMAAPDDWVKGMLEGWPTPEIPVLPPDWEALIPRARQLVASFIHHRRQLLYNMPEEPAKAGRAWPSPRTWDMAARFLAAAMSLMRHRDKDLIVSLVGAAVGEPAALEFAQCLVTLDLPDPRKLLEDPEKWEIPDRGDLLMATLSGIVGVATSSDANLERYWSAAWRLLERATLAGYGDVAAAVAAPLAQAFRPGLPIPTQVVVEAMGPIWKMGDKVAKPKASA